MKASKLNNTIVQLTGWLIFSINYFWHAPTEYTLKLKVKLRGKSGIENVS